MRIGHLLDDDATRRVVVAVDDAAAHPDAFLAAVIAALMVAERLDVEVAYAPANPSAATRVYGLPHGAAAERLATEGIATSFPLIRDDAATVLVGSARHLGADGAQLHGETYVDNDRLFRGEVRGVLIEPTRAEPGLRARVERRLRPGRWHHGRAAQTGGSNLLVEREGIVTRRVVKRSTFYRHHVDLKLVCP